MPWTFAHPAAVLPLRHVPCRRLSFCTLVVGSMAPDFGFYFGSFAISRKAHTLWGLLTICLPSGLALIAIIRLLHRPIGNLLPLPHRQRILSLPPLRSLSSVPAFIWASIALLIGGSTHIFWDSFTHESGYFVTRWPIMQYNVAFPGNKGFEIYEMLQNASSIVGAALVILAYRRWIRCRPTFRHAHEQTDDRWRYQILATLAIAAIMVAAPLAYSVSVAIHGWTNPTLFAVRLLIYSTTAFFIFLSVTSVAIARATTDSSDN